ncbi:D-2-hydroxyacid dehydrogenase [soil metagenome]
MTSLPASAPDAPEWRLLLSSQARDRIAADIHGAVSGQRLRIVTFEQAIDDPGCDADLAFITRDVTGRSTKHEVSDSLQACYSVLRRASALRWVHTHSAGLDRPIFGELAARGVEVTSSSGANAQNVAHSAVGGLLALARRFPKLFAAQREHRWSSLIDADQPRDLPGQTAVIVGWGPIGRSIAALLQVIGLTVRVVRRNSEPAGDAIATFDFDHFAQAIDAADWVVLACPLTEITRGLLDAETLDRLPRGACIVNVSRGEVIDEAALIERLRSGQLGGAFLDVFSHEPLDAASPLWDMPGVIVSPHSAGHGTGNAARVEQIFIQRLRDWIARS